MANRLGNYIMTCYSERVLQYPKSAENNITQFVAFGSDWVVQFGISSQLLSSRFWVFGVGQANRRALKLRLKWMFLFLYAFSRQFHVIEIDAQKCIIFEIDLYMKIRFCPSYNVINQVERGVNSGAYYSSFILMVLKISFFGMGQCHKKLGVCFFIKVAERDWVTRWIGT